VAIKLNCLCINILLFYLLPKRFSPYLYSCLKFNHTALGLLYILFFFGWHFANLKFMVYNHVFELIWKSSFHIHLVGLFDAENVVKYRFFFYVIEIPWLVWRDLKALNRVLSLPSSTSHFMPVLINIFFFGLDNVTQT